MIAAYEVKLVVKPIDGTASKHEGKYIRVEVDGVTKTRKLYLHAKSETFLVAIDREWRQIEVKQGKAIAGKVFAVNSDVAAA